MSSRNARSVAASVLVLWTASAPCPALASPLDVGEQASAVLERLWSGLTSLWAKEGCQVLPDGRIVCPKPDAVPPGIGPGLPPVEPVPASRAPQEPGADTPRRSRPDAVKPRG